MAKIMRVSIPERNFYLLPAATQQLIRTYGISVGILGKRNAPLMFDIAEYRWSEIEQSLITNHTGE